MTNELKDTIEMMNNSDYRERFKAEYHQLRIRLEKLKITLESYKAGTLKFEPACSYELLFEQSIYMQHYLHALEKRAMKENINLFS